MNGNGLAQSSVEKLVSIFQSIALDQEAALLDDEIAKYNRLFDRMEAVETELKGRHGDQRRALGPLLGHASAEVRLKAALAMLAVEPALARAALQTISDRNEYPQAAHARGMMSAIDEGRYVPT